MSKKKNNKHNKRNKHNNKNKYIPSEDKFNTKQAQEVKNNDDKKNFSKNLEKQKKYSNDKTLKNIIVLGSAAVLFTGSASLVYLNNSRLSELSYNGIYIDSEHVGKLDKIELTSKISNLLNEKTKNNTINILGENDIIHVTPEKIGVSYDIDKIVSDIMSYKKKNSKIANTISQLSLNMTSHNIEYSPSINEDILNTFISSIEKKFYTSPKNASITFNKDTITASKETLGYKVDTEKLKEDLLTCINSNFTDNTTIKLSYLEVQPKLTKNTAEKLQILGTFKTKLPSKTGDRTGNIKLYTSKLNKSILSPGEELSCDKAGGDRTWAEGYRNANGYVDGEVVPILAGGICQATSTIYNALLYADLEITERHPHSMPVTYAKLGLDAAIAKGIKDLRFKNNTENPIILQTYVNQDGYVVATIWGIPTVENKKIELFTKQFNSKSADAYRKVYIDGKLIATEKISSNRYK